MGAAAFLSGCGWLGPTFKLSYHVAFPANHAQYKLAADWADEVKRRTHGRVRVAVISDVASDQNGASCYRGVADGRFDIGMGAFSSAHGCFPLLEGLDLPVGFPDGESATRAANALFAKYRPAECGQVKMLYLHACGPAVLAAKRPVLGLAGMKGLKVWTAENGAGAAERLGAVPVVRGDACEALKTGAADAVFCPLAAFKTERLAEVVNCMTDTKFVGCSTAFFVAVNQTRWSALPPDLQQVVEAVCAEWAAQHGQAWNRAHGEGFAALKANRRDVVPLPDFERPAWSGSVAPLLQDYALRADRKGLPGSAFLEDLKKAVREARAEKGTKE